MLLAEQIMTEPYIETQAEPEKAAYDVAKSRIMALFLSLKLSSDLNDSCFTPH